MLAQQLRIVPGLRWAFDFPRVQLRIFPRWTFDSSKIQPYIGWLATPIGLLALALLVEGRSVDLSQQYRGLLPGDLFLGVTWFAASMLAQELHGENQWYQRNWFRWLAVGFGAACLLGLTIPEAIVTYSMQGQPNIMTWGAFFSPTKVYHTLILPTYGYAMFALVMPALVEAPWRAWHMVMRLVALGGIVGWVICVVLDNTLPRPDTTCVHISNGWPLLQRPLSEWWQGAAGCPQRG